MLSNPLLSSFLIYLPILFYFHYYFDAFLSDSIPFFIPREVGNIMLGFGCTTDFLKLFLFGTFSLLGFSIKLSIGFTNSRIYILCMMALIRRCTRSIASTLLLFSFFFCSSVPFHFSYFYQELMQSHSHFISSLFHCTLSVLRGTYQHGSKCPNVFNYTPSGSTWYPFD